MSTIEGCTVFTFFNHQVYNSTESLTLGPSTARVECTARFNSAVGMQVTCIVNSDFTGNGITSIRYSINDQEQEEGIIQITTFPITSNNKIFHLQLYTSKILIITSLFFFTASSIPTFFLGIERFRNGRNRIVLQISHAEHGTGTVAMDLDLSIPVPTTPPPPPPPRM